MLHRITTVVQVAKLQIAASVRLPPCWQRCLVCEQSDSGLTLARPTCFFFVFLSPRSSFSPLAGRHLDFQTRMRRDEYQDILHGQWANQIA